jgi:hypothetical protein
MSVIGTYIMKNEDWLYEVVDSESQEDHEHYVYLDELVRNDDGAAIALCTLSAVNWGNIKKPADFQRPCELAVRGLDALLSYQNYPILAAEMSTREFRPLGVGIINLAYWLAKNDVSYSDPAALPLVDEYAEAWSYYLQKASADLAVEQGPCELWQHLKSSQGILPIDTRKLDVDELVPHQERMPWQQLREQVRATGMRNATVMALMPAECQSLTNTMTLKDGSSTTLAAIIQDHGNIDIDKVHSDMMIGQRFPFLKPVELSNSTAYECYYNGPMPVTEIEFEDGSTYKFTENHKLLVHRGGTEVWITVSELSEDDDIITGIH